jgi:hypothetical protein
LSQKIRPSARKFFVITVYFPGAGGVFEPAIPTTCPQGSSHKQSCDVRPHFFRERKTGPCFPLTVVRCFTHGCSFTLYPPGFGPYLRAPVLELAPDGTSPLPEKKDKPNLEAFEGSLFQAALDGEQGKTWERDSLDGVPDHWWSTQGRHLDLALRLLGISRASGARLRERIASVLSIDHLLLKEQSGVEKDGYRSRAKAICGVLRRLKQGMLGAIRLLFCGCLIGHWPIPWSWDPKREILERLPFRLPPIRAPA